MVCKKYSACWIKSIEETLGSEFTAQQHVGISRSATYATLRTSLFDRTILFQIITVKLWETRFCSLKILPGPVMAARESQSHIPLDSSES